VALLRIGAGRSRPSHADAYDAALLGRYFHRRGTREDMEKAVAYFTKATEIDPASAIAWAGLGLARLRQASHGHSPLEDGYRTARMAARRAIELEPDLSDGHTLLAMVHMERDWDWSTADAEFKRAMALDPGHAGCASNAAWLANVLGRHEEALELSRRASELDPLSVSNWSNRGMFAWYARRFEMAEAMYRKALELDPAFPLTRAKLGRVHLSAGRNEEALREAQAERNDAFRLQGVVMAQHALGRAAESEAALAEMIRKYGEGGAFQIGEAFAFRGDATRAFEWLERAYDQRDVGLISLKGRPLLSALWPDPRWAELLTRMRLPV
jgi:tetratricopeptide (TPR) repeat protein